MESSNKKTSAELPHKCPECFKVFSSRNGLSTHFRIHTVKKSNPVTCLICNRTFSDGRKARIHYRFHRNTVQKWHGGNQMSYNDEDAMKKYLVPEQQARGILGPQGEVLEGLQQMPGNMAQQQPSPPTSPLAPTTATTSTVAAAGATPGVQNDAQQNSHNMANSHQYPSPQEQPQAQSPHEHQVLGWRGWEEGFPSHHQPTQPDLPRPELNNMNPTSPTTTEPATQSPYAGQSIDSATDFQQDNSWGTPMEEGQLGFLGHIPEFSDPPPPPPPPPLPPPSASHQYPVVASSSGFIGGNGYDANTNLTMKQQGQGQGPLPIPQPDAFPNTNQLGTFSATQQSSAFSATLQPSTFSVPQLPSTFLNPTQPGGFSILQQPATFTAPPPVQVPAQSALPFPIQQLPSPSFSGQQQPSSSFSVQAQPSSPCLVQEQAAAGFPYFFPEQSSLLQFTFNIPAGGFIADVVAQEQQQQPMHLNTKLSMPVDWTSIISPPSTTEEESCPSLVPLDSWPLDKEAMAQIRARCRILESDLAETEASRERALRHGWKKFDSLSIYGLRPQ